MNCAENISSLSDQFVRMTFYQRQIGRIVEFRTALYLIRSIPFPEQTYIGLTSDLKTRIKAHNNGGSPHTSKYKPWKIQTYLAFSTRKQAAAFERYLKTGSGRAFAKKRL